MNQSNAIKQLSLRQQKPLLLGSSPLLELCYPHQKFQKKKNFPSVPGVSLALAEWQVHIWDNSVCIYQITFSPYFRLSHLRWGGSWPHKRARTPGQMWLSALFMENLLVLAAFLTVRDKAHLGCWRHRAKVSTCPLGNSKGWWELLQVLCASSIFFLL